MDDVALLLWPLNVVVDNAPDRFFFLKFKIWVIFNNIFCKSQRKKF